MVNRKGKITSLTDLNGDVFGHKTMHKPQLMEVKSSVDGRELQAWIVTPPDFDPSKKYPLILEIHGGPFTSYGPVFSGEIQLMAAYFAKQPFVRQPQAVDAEKAKKLAAHFVWGHRSVEAAAKCL